MEAVLSNPQVIFVGDRQAALDAAIRAKAAANPVLNYYNSPVGRSMTFGLHAAAGDAYYRAMLDSKSLPELVEELGRTLDLGVPLAAFSLGEVASRFRFENGHFPREGRVYVRHPAKPAVYLPPEEFSRNLAQAKEGAFRILASALGAKEVRLVMATMKTKSGLFGAKLSLAEAATDVGIKASFNSKGECVKKVYDTFGFPRVKPFVPPDLAAWVEMDSDLGTMAQQRTEGTLLTTSVTLEFKEGMGGGGEVAAKVAARGLTAGLSYSAISHSIWQFEVEYWPEAEDRPT